MVVTALVLSAAPTWAVNCLSGIPASNPDSIYTVHGDGTATDIRTGLMWKVCAEGQTWAAGSCTGTATQYAWNGALTQAEASAYAGHGDWRLPNIKELRSLVEECRYNPSINDSVFPDTQGVYFWSASPSVANLNSAAWVVFFGYGETSFQDRGYGFNFVRLVRAGQ